MSLLSSCVARADPDKPRHPRDRWAALALSLGGAAASVETFSIGARLDRDGHGTAASRELMIAGASSLVLTPSLGQWYAGRPVTAGLALRVLGGALLIAGVKASYSSSVDDWGPVSSRSPPARH